MAARDIDKHLIGRHDQEDHDPTKKKSRADVDARNKAMGLEYGDHGSLLYDDLDPNDKRHSRNAHDKTLQRVTAGVGGVAGYALAGPTGAVLGAGVGAGVGSRAGMRNQRGALPPGTRLNYVDKHLIGRHNQEDHDPNKKERDHSREEHENVERVRGPEPSNFLGYEDTPKNSAALNALAWAVLLGAMRGGSGVISGGLGGAALGYQAAGGQIFGNPEGSTAGGIAAGLGNVAVDPLGTAIRRGYFGNPNDQVLSSRDKEELKLSKREESIMSTRIGFLLSKAGEHSNSEDELHDNIADLVDSVEKMIIAKSNLPEEVSKQTVTVEEYTRSDGTVVPRHERKISGRAMAAVAGAAGAAALASPLGRPLRSGFRAGMQSGSDMASWRNTFTARNAPGTRAGLELGSAASRTGQAAMSGPRNFASGLGRSDAGNPSRAYQLGARGRSRADSFAFRGQGARNAAQMAPSNMRRGMAAGQAAGSSGRSINLLRRISGASQAPGTRAGLEIGNAAGAARRGVSNAAGATGRGANSARSGVNAARINFQAGRSIGAQGGIGFRGAGLTGQVSPSLGAGVAAGATQNAAQRAGRYVADGGALGQMVGPIPWQAQAGATAGVAAVGGGYYANQRRNRMQKSLSDADIYVLEKYLGRNLDG